MKKAIFIILVALVTFASCGSFLCFGLFNTKDKCFKSPAMTILYDAGIKLLVLPKLAYHYLQRN